jgi:hypothetical protein
MKMEQTECSESSTYKIQMPGNYPEESIQQDCESYLYLRKHFMQKNIMFRIRGWKLFVLTRKMLKYQLKSLRE